VDGHACDRSFRGGQFISILLSLSFEFVLEPQLEAADVGRDVSQGGVSVVRQRELLHDLRDDEERLVIVIGFEFKREIAAHGVCIKPRPPHTGSTAGAPLGDFYPGA
jgi:hypothetical protein